LGEVKMKIIKNVVGKLFDIVEIYVPMAAFVCVFVTYIVIILYRYIFYASIDWINELNVLAFVWSAVFAASYGGRSGKHVMFTIIYDKISKKAQLAFRLIGNIFIIAIFIILLPYTCESVSYIAIKKTPIMKLPFSLVFLPFLSFVVLTIIHYAVFLIKDIKLSIALCKGEITE
jgi:TRAP-type C4-dicarboxylate transport system permease small subunit